MAVLFRIFFKCRGGKKKEKQVCPVLTEKLGNEGKDINVLHVAEE